MEEFSVRSSSVRQASQYLDSFQGFLSDRSSEIDTIRRQLRGKISQHEAIGFRLRTIADTVDSLQDTMRMMSHCLERVDYYYQRAEDRITGQSNPFSEIMDLLSTGSEEKKVFSFFGMDGSITNSQKFMDGEQHHDDIPGGKSGGGSGSVFTGNQSVKYGDFEGNSTEKTFSGEYNYYAYAQGNKDNFGAAIGGNTEGSVYNVNAEGSFLDGLFKNQTEISFMTGAAAGRAGIHLFKNRDPRYSGIYAKGEAGGSVLHGSNRTQIGTEKNYRYYEVEGDLLTAGAQAGAGFGYLGTDSDGSEVYGLEFGAGAEAYLAKGTVHSGFSVFGIEVDIGVTGKVGGAGVDVGGGVTNQGIDLNAGLGLGFGGDLELSVDWTKASWPSWLPRP